MFLCRNSHYFYLNLKTNSKKYFVSKVWFSGIKNLLLYFIFVFSIERRKFICFFSCFPLKNVVNGRKFVENAKKKWQMQWKRNVNEFTSNKKKTKQVQWYMVVQKLVAIVFILNSCSFMHTFIVPSEIYIAPQRAIPWNLIKLS